MATQCPGTLIQTASNHDGECELGPACLAVGLSAEDYRNAHANATTDWLANPDTD